MIDPTVEADDRSIMCLATQGAGHLDENRILALLAPLGAGAFPFDRAHKLRSGVGLVRAARRERPRLIVLEGTGVAGGLGVLACRALLGIPYIVSSGDAVGPYLGLRSRLAGRAGGIYERVLCRRSAGFIGWTPYLVGRALTFGAPRAMTAPGWGRGEPSAGARERVRARLGIAPETIVIGIVGSLQRSARTGYSYGLELVRALALLERTDVAACIVGDGSGRAALEELAGAELGTRVLMPGRVPAEEVPDHLAAFDLASLPQSVDGVGSFRYTTKLSEYLAAGLPIVTGQIPAAYDLDEGQLWRLPGPSPWSEEYVGALAQLLARITREEIEQHRAAIASRRGEPFERAAQQRRVQAFVEDVLAAK